jgi:ferredoxin
MSFHVTLQPSGRQYNVGDDETLLTAAIREGIGLPYGCKDGACGSCKCKLIEGQVVMGEHQEKALSAAEQAAGMILTCRATAQSDVVLEARGVAAEGQFPVLKMPGRVLSLERLAEDVMRVKVQLPANQNFQFHAGQYIEFLLRDGARRAYSMANARTTWARRRPSSCTSATCPAASSPTRCSARSRKRTSCAWKGRSAASTCARTATSPSCCWPRAPASRRSRP